MDKRTALETLEFAYEDGKYKKVICEKEGTIYKLAWEPGKTAYQVEIKKPDGSEDTQGAGKFVDTELYQKIQELADAIKQLMESPVERPPEEVVTPELVTGYVDGGYEEQVRIYREPQLILSQNNVLKKRPQRSIVGLTPRLAECGKIKIGKKGAMMTSQKGTQFRPPEKFDHFLVTTMDKENDDFKPDESLMKKLGGDSCREIPVRLPYDDPTLNFPTSYAYYDSAACKCRGDGECAITSTGETIECDPENCPNVKSKKCKPNGVLSVILDDAPRVGGVYKFRTTGWNSINNIYSSMEFIRGLTNGMLAGLPLMLTLTPKHTTIPGTKTPTTIYMVNLEYRGSLQEMADAIKQTISTRALMQYSIKDFEKIAEDTLALPEAPEECKEIVAEFYPEAVEGA